MRSEPGALPLSRTERLRLVFDLHPLPLVPLEMLLLPNVNPQQFAEAHDLLSVKICLRIHGPGGPCITINLHRSTDC